MSADSNGPSDRDGGQNKNPSPNDDTSEALQVARVEAHRTLDEQLDTLEDIDGKAIQLLQFTIGLVGVVISVLSFTGIRIGASSMPYLGGGLVLLIVGAVVAGVTYTISPRIAGVGPADLKRASEVDSERAFRRTLVRSYADWIAFNAVANARAAFLITVAVLLVVAGALGLALGIIQTLVGPLSSAITVVALLGFLVAAYGAGVHRQAARLRAVERPVKQAGLALPETAPEARFDGQLCHKGSIPEERKAAPDETDATGAN